MTLHPALHILQCVFPKKKYSIIKNNRTIMKFRIPTFKAILCIVRIQMLLVIGRMTFKMTLEGKGSRMIRSREG